MLKNSSRPKPATTPPSSDPDVVEARKGWHADPLMVGWYWLWRDRRKEMVFVLDPASPSKPFVARFRRLDGGTQSELAWQADGDLFVKIITPKDPPLDEGPAADVASRGMHPGD